MTFEDNDFEASELVVSHVSSFKKSASNKVNQLLISAVEKLFLNRKMLLCYSNTTV